MAKVKREEILHQLESVQPGLAPREIIEQSSCFIFKDKQVTTYNDEVACSRDSCLDITGAVQAKPLLDLLKKLVEDEISIETKDGELLIKGKKRESGIRMDKEIVLPIDSLEKPGKWKKLPEDFGDAVQIVQQCAMDDASHELASVHLTSKWIEATDNFQMSRFTISLKIKKSVSIRRNSLKHVVPLGMTEFSESDNWMHFKNPTGVVLSCRKFQEDYPNLTGFLDVSGEPTVLPKGLAGAVEKAEIFASDNSDSSDDNQILVELKKGKLTVTGQGASGWYKERKKLSYSGGEMSFRIKPKLLVTITQSHNECEITEDKLKVDGGKFTYITCLGRPENKTDA